MSAWRNRLMLCLGIVAVVALVYIGTTYELHYSPADRLEQDGYADILHFGLVESRWAANTVVHVAAILYPPVPDFSDAYVVVENTTYAIKRGGYAWDPEVRESPAVQYTHWTLAKFLYYKESALFPPGKFEPAQEAIKTLLKWMNDEREEVQDRAVRKWLYLVVEEACKYEEDWSWIEIDLFNVAEEPTPTLIADRRGRPSWAAGYELTFTYTVWLYRRSPEDSEWVLDNVLQEGELSSEKMEWMSETGQMQAQPAMTWFGPIPYAFEEYGFNHPWQGREANQ